MRNLYYLYLIIYKKIYDNISNKKIDWNFILKFTFVTLFPNLIEPYLKDSILNRAVESNLISYEFYNPRDFATNKHKKVDDAMVGGGAGMLLSCQPLFDCLEEIKIKDKDKKRLIIWIENELDDSSIFEIISNIEEIKKMLKNELNFVNKIIVTFKSN